jgi:hypothetical protein
MTRRRSGELSSGVVHCVRSWEGRPGGLVGVSQDAAQRCSDISHIAHSPLLC